MRQDIEIHINTRDISIDPQNQPKLREFRWVANSNGSARYIYGEVDIPSVVTDNSVRGNGFYFSIPYTPKYKEFMIRIRRVHESGSHSYVMNWDSGSEWFVVRVSMYGGEQRNVFASQLVCIDDNQFYGRIGKDCIELYSAKQSDVNIVSADRQNANCMLACNPSNNYRYPLTGVGLVRWVNSSHINSGGLADILQREFGEDGVIVKNAQYDYDKKALSQLELDTSHAE